ncbi:DsbA family protein [Streptacidiphilus sp. ASG 303]|uniref:DsbA family protein n=1 Tax=Streptacidiphilus sp. ASG 303 TaxID=2896847 RepID=UPI001E6558CA|nr:thioredoxin domain-containing protein [Streptacidiphilus sp. ASG 303]MCD0481573.1 DsbA family protein [Streptacidiphilus sp. ASG 303]
MSEKNRDGKRSARERLAAERQAQEDRARRKRKLVVLGSVVAVVAVAVGVGVAVQSRRSQPETPVAAPSGAVGDRKLVIPDGAANAPATLTVYEDPRCPACQLFEKAFRPTVDRLKDEGKIVANYHIVSFIDRHDSGTGSKNGANALACAQDAGRFRAYHNVLYANQPPETEDPWSNRGALISLAGKVPGLDTPAFRACVNGNTYGGWVSAVQQDFDKSGFTSTPTVLLNGESVFPRKGGQDITPANLTAWVDAANKGKRLGTPASPAASPAAGPSASPAAKAHGRTARRHHRPAASPAAVSPAPAAAPLAPGAAASTAPASTR